MLCVVFGTTVLPSSICFWKIFGEIVLSVLFQNSWLLAVSTKSPNLTNDCVMKIPWFIWGWRLLKLSFVWSQQTLHRTPTTAPCTFTSISQGYAFSSHWCTLFSILQLLMYQAFSAHLQVDTEVSSSHIYQLILSMLAHEQMESKREKLCVHCIFASLFLKSKREQIWNLEKCFLFQFKSSFCSPENQTLEF